MKYGGNKMYKCYDCGRLHDKLPYPLRCDECAGRIFIKLRPDVVRRVKAI